MDVCQTIAQIRRHVAAARAAGRTIGFVPTMGALHAGHASLIDAARADASAASASPGGAPPFTVVSIFVNPTQFAPGEDLARYPRTMDADLALCRAHGVDLVFAPAAAEIYPPGDQTRVRVGPLADALCGPFRPGHFEGVCTVVARLFGIVQPDVAYFGQKDAQQAVIIRRMTADLCLPVRIDVRPIVREPDGLAMSSRNAYLAAEQRRQATSVYAALSAGRDALAAGETSPGKLIARMSGVLHAAGPCTIDYIAAVDPESLAGLDPLRRPVLLALAVRMGDVRLIDNLAIE